MSRTRIPANGNVGETASAAVARPRHIGHIEPFTVALGPRGLDKLSKALEVAIVPLSKVQTIAKKKERRYDK